MTVAASGVRRGGLRPQNRGNGPATPDGVSSGRNRWVPAWAARRNPRTAGSRRTGGAVAAAAHAERRTSRCHGAPAAAACVVRAAGSAPSGAARRFPARPSAGAWAAVAARASRRRVRCRDRRRRHGRGGAAGLRAAWSACARRGVVRSLLRLPLLPPCRALRLPGGGGAGVGTGGAEAGHPLPGPAPRSGPGEPTPWRVCGEPARKVSL